MLSRQVPRMTKHLVTLTKRRHIAVTVAGVRHISTNDPDKQSFETISLKNVDPFENIAVRRYTTEEDDYESPNPFENIAKVRRPMLGLNVVASPYVDFLMPEDSVAEFVWKNVDKWSNRTAIECAVSGRGYTYAELRTACRRFAGSLRRAGLQPGHMIAVVLPNAPEYAVVFVGALEAGVVVTTVNPNYVPAEIATQLLDAHPSMIVTDSDKYEDVVKAVKMAAERGYKQPDIVVAPSATSSQVPGGATALADMIDTECEECSRLDAVDASTVAVIPYSSGTTGLPKGVCLSHHNLIANIAQMESHPELSVITRTTTDTVQEVMPAVLPFYHIYGMTCLLLSKLRVGVKIVTLPKFEPTSFLNMLKNHKATLLFLVPPLVLYMGSSKDVTSELLSHARFVGSGAAPLGQMDVERFMTKAPPGVKFAQGYGMTETSSGVLSLIPGTNKFASVGKVVPNVLVKVVDVETGEALGADKVGELCLQGPQNMVGYHNNPEATQEMIDKDGWLHTGDLGYYDDDKDFYIVDRLKELIKVNAYQVAPAELEEILRSHPDVLDAGVIGIPDARCGELPLAFVVARSSGSVDPDRVMEFVALQTSSHKHLAGVRVVEAIPRSPAGKILRKTLRDDYAKELEVAGSRVQRG